MTYLTADQIAAGTGRALHRVRCVDTAAVAVHIGCTPGMVRLLVHCGILAPAYRAPRGRMGRPCMWFDLYAVTDAIEAAVDSGRVQLDTGKIRLRKSRS